MVFLCTYRSSTQYWVFERCSSISICFDCCEKVGGLLVSFDLNIGQIMQYAFNLFASVLPLIYLFAGAAFAVFIVMKLIAIAKGS